MGYIRPNPCSDTMLRIIEDEWMIVLRPNRDYIYREYMRDMGETLILGDYTNTLTYPLTPPLKGNVNAMALHLES